MAEYPEWLEAIQTAQLELPIRYYYEDTGTIGYMYPGQRESYLNRKFFDGYTNCQRASVIAHESLHHLGFRHKRDPAYQVNFAFEACCLP